MTNKGVLERFKDKMETILQEKGLADASVTVLAKPLTPEEAIGEPGRRDFPILKGKERLIEAEVLGSRGQAFTDTARDFIGTLADVMALPLDSNGSRAVFLAAMNAALAHLGMVRGTLHCKNEDPEECGAAIASEILAASGKVKVGLIGFNPAMGQRLIETFGAGSMAISDLSPDVVGQERFGVKIQDGLAANDALVEGSDVIVMSGTTMVNDTFDPIMDKIEALGKDYFVFGVTTAGPAAILGFRRICPKAREG